MLDTETIHYYYLRENNPKDKTAKVGKPYGVVAIRANDDGTINRGISLCSKKDSFKKSTGRGIALSRLLKAETECKNGGKFMSYYGANQSCPLNYRGFDLEFKYENEEIYSHKSMFHARMTQLEYRMFHKPEELK